MRRLHVSLILVAGCVIVLGDFSRPVDADTIAYWRFENDLTDISGNANDATAHGSGTSFSTSVFGTPVPQTGAPNDNSLALVNPLVTANSATGYLQVSDDPSLDIASGSFTIEAWVTLDHAGDDPEGQYLLQKNGAVDDSQSAFIFVAKAGSIVAPSGDESVMALGFGTGATTTFITSNFGIPFADFDWHYMSVAVDRPSGDVRFILDDQMETLAGAAAGLGIDNDHPLTIGARSTTSGFNTGLDGGIDELRISNTFLPPGELLNAVPEPATVSLAAVAVILVFGFVIFSAKRRRTQKEASACQ